MLRRWFSLVSVDSFLVLILLLALQYFPIPGVILMMFGAAMITGLLVHVFLASLFFEALTRRIPRAFLLVPILAYGGYYTAYVREARQIALFSAELRGANPVKILDFDPKLHALVMAQAQSFVETHDVPVAYAPDAKYPEAYLSNRLITRTQCAGIVKDTQSRVLTFGVHFNGVFQQSICLLRFPERPPNETVTVTLRGDPQIWAHHADIREQATAISIDGKVVGSFRTASVWRLPLFPLPLIGCALNSGAPSWNCFANFNRSYMLIDGIPDSIDRSIFDDPVSVMLGIRKYASADLSNFAGFDSSAMALDHVHKEPALVEANVFEVLQAIVDGRNPDLPFNLGYSIATRPERLVPFAEGMTHRFVALIGDKSATPNRREQLEVLAKGIGALPHKAFVGVAPLLFDVIKEGQIARKQYPMLYVRVAEAGATTLPFYRDQFMGDDVQGWQKMLPVLALCRIGEGDGEIIEEMKKRYAAVEPKGGGDPTDYQSALFVTLLKLGQGSFLQANPPSMKRLDAWSSQILAGAGMTEMGPNNCMPQRWVHAGYTTPEMAPSLKPMRDGWASQKRF